MKITKSELKKLYMSRSNKDAAKELGCSEITLLRTLKRAGIPLKGKGQHYHMAKRRIEVVDS